MDGREREQVFGDKLDCRFPYDDFSAAAALISEARAISTNATFCVFYELVQPPKTEGDGLTADRKRQLLSLWRDGFDHPLADLLMMLAERVLADERLPLDEILFAMDEIARFDGQYAALASLSSLAYADNDEDFSALDAREEKIRAGWDAKRSP